MTGPYIVTTKRPTPWVNLYETTSRVAVATLAKAREAAWQARLDQWRGENPAWLPVMAQVNALPESGGTVGPLPDGTVIEVEQTTWHYLWEHSDLPPSDSHPGQQRILDAFNAQEASR